MKNKNAKQMISDAVLKGRVAIWQGDESEVFAAKSLKQIEDEFGVTEEFPDDNGNVVSRNWKYWWTLCVSEKEWDSKNKKYLTKGSKVLNKDGSAINYYERLPLICGVYGGENDVAQVLTCYS